MMQHRIPDFTNKSKAGVKLWFSEMSSRDLLFHPDDSPSEIFRIATGEKTFTKDECSEIERIIGEMFDRFSDDIYDIAFPIFAERMGIQLNIDD